MAQKKHLVAFKGGQVLSLIPEPQLRNADVLVSHDGTIAYIGVDRRDELYTAERVIDATGKWLLPGFVSGHSHLWQSKYAGHAPNSAVSEWGEGLYSQARDLSASDYYDLTMHGAKSHIRKGITTAFNFTFSARFRDGRADRAQFEGALDSGIRFIHGFNIGAIKENWTPELATARARRFIDWASTFKHHGQYLGTMIAHHGINYDTDVNTRMEAEIMRKLEIGGQIHYLESPKPADVNMERSRWEWLRDAGALDSKLILGHFLHPTPSILEEAAKRGLKMTWNPMSNGRLGSGIADIPAYQKYNLPIGLGVDGEASSDRSDPFENMRAGIYAVRGKYTDPTVLKAYDVFYMHTLGAAEVLGVADQVGSLAVGKQADIILLDPPSCSSLGDIVSPIVFSSGVESIEAVFIGGQEFWPQKMHSSSAPRDWPAWEF
ncbi:amidohydrolase [Colletotrichum truncatum]|uniref:Amidohydrolase n=1 Tax=Colletotrichum truncatum TaxID=5467 RepID=A0ACC3YQ78_COLTU|nr:amidohydrolase [Colletotrichum truncatum]KAF6796671.1 amidohydrolase [Colletotrichum truncatum]